MLVIQVLEGSYARYTGFRGAYMLVIQVLKGAHMLVIQVLEGAHMIVIQVLVGLICLLYKY